MQLQELPHKYMFDSCSCVLGLIWLTDNNIGQLPLRLICMITHIGQLLLCSFAQLLCTQVSFLCYSFVQLFFTSLHGNNHSVVEMSTAVVTVAKSTQVKSTYIVGQSMVFYFISS